MRKPKGKDQYVKAVEYSHTLEKLLIMERENSAALRDELDAAERECDDYRHRCKVSDGVCAIAEQQREHWMQRAKVAETELARRDAAAGEPVLYALRFKNMQGEPEKEINDNCLFSSYEKARAYGRGGNYVTQDSGKIEWVHNAALDPEVIPLYTAAPPVVLPDLEQDVKNIIGLLAENEWAEHCTKSELGRGLECEITRLHDLRAQPQNPVVLPEPERHREPGIIVGMYESFVVYKALDEEGIPYEVKK